MSSILKKIITILVLVSFLTIVFLSFAVMIHEPGMRVPGNCPFSAMGEPLCPENIEAMVSHHLSAYQSFFNVTVDFGITALILSLLLVAGVLFAVFISPSSLRSLSLAGIFYHVPLNTSFERNITRWLALHENSPATF